MASKRRPPYRHPRDARWWEDPPREWKPWSTMAVIIILLGIIVYACSGAAGAEPAKRWDLYHWIWPEPPTPPQQPPVATPTPPVQPPPVVAPVQPPAPPVAPTPPAAPDPPVMPPQPPPIVVQPPPFDPPPIIKTPTAPIIVLPPPALSPQPQPQSKAKNGRGKEAKEANNKPVNNNKPPKPPKPKQKAAEPETNEYLPPCSLVCWYAQGKTRAQLEAEAATRNPTARMRRHALACLAGCNK